MKLIAVLVLASCAPKESPITVVPTTPTGTAPAAWEEPAQPAPDDLPDITGGVVHHGHQHKIKRIEHEAARPIAIMSVAPYCIMVDGGAHGFCGGGLDGCQALASFLGVKDKPCVERSFSACFLETIVGNGVIFSSCSPNVTDCEDERQTAATKLEYRDVSRTCMILRYEP